MGQNTNADRVRRKKRSIKNLGFSAEVANRLVELAGENLAFEVARWTKCATGGLRGSTPWDTAKDLINEALDRNATPTEYHLKAFLEAEMELPTIAPQMLPTFFEASKVALLAM